jgi:hypothetical protein
MTYDLSLVDIGGAEFFSWSEQDPQQYYYECKTEKNIFGIPYQDCDYFPDPPTYTTVNSSTTPTLPDTDQIQIRVSDAVPGQVQVVLSVGYYIGWWKGIWVNSLQSGGISVQYDLFGDDGSIAPGEPDDRVQSPPVALATADILQNQQQRPGNGVIWLGKAKFLGFHEWIYRIPILDLVPFDGKRVQFHWTMDNN